MAITGDHVRMLRGALRLNTMNFARLCGIDKMTVSTLERGAKAQLRTQDKIREAFAAYVEFIEPVEGVRGAGIVMKWGVQPIGDASDDTSDDATDTPSKGLRSQAWDDFTDATPSDPDFPPIEITDEEREELREYLKTADVSPGGRAVLTRDFGL